MKNKYDLAIIGAGPAGISCAKNSLKYGLKTILFDKDIKHFGGTCLNTGCIPTKFFLNSAKLHKDWPLTSQKKNQIIEKIKTPLLNYLAAKKITIKWGKAYFSNKNTLVVDEDKIEADKIVLAAGSSPQRINSLPQAFCAEELFTFDALPNKFLIVGGGYIGVEFASLLNGFNKEVTIVEKEKNILPSIDSYLSSRLKIILQKKGIKINTGGDLANYNTADFDCIITAAGRKSNLDGLGIEKIGLEVNERGWIKTNQYTQTNIDNIYACGDVTGKKLLAYAADYQGRICIENILGKRIEEDYTAVPECVFSIPQIAKAGLLEDEAKKNNLKYKVVKTNFLKFSSSHVYNDTDGFMEVLVDEKEKIIGAGIISNMAGELINIFSLCIKNNLTIHDLKRCIFPHPTLSEIIPLALEE